MEANITLKTIFCRKLKNGNYVILAADSEPLVVEEDFATCISQDGNALANFDESVISVFKDSGFFADALSDTVIPEEPTGKKWNLLRQGVFIISVMALLGVLMIIPFSGIPLGNRMIPANVPMWMSVIFMIGFSIATTMIHELLHMLYANTLKKQNGGVKIVLKKSMATVNMTHIWVWSFLGRVAAVSAGIMSDLLILCICSILGLYNDSWIILAAASILWVRILWQFRFHRKTDGRLILMLLLDNPVIALGNENDADFTYEKDVLIWKVFQVIGVLVEIAVVVFWGIPFVLSIYTNLFV